MIEMTLDRYYELREKCYCQKDWPKGARCLNCVHADEFALEFGRLALKVLAQKPNAFTALENALLSVQEAANALRVALSPLGG